MLAVSVAILVALFGGLRPRELLRLAMGALLAVVILWPVAHPYLRMRAFQGVEFTIETVAIYAASLPSYAAAGTEATMGVTITYRAPGSRLQARASDPDREIGLLSGIALP